MGLACVTEVHLNPFNSRPMSNLNPDLFPLSRNRPNSASLLFPRACVADEWGRGAPCSSYPLGQGRTRLHHAARARAWPHRLALLAHLPRDGPHAEGVTRFQATTKPQLCPWKIPHAKLSRASPPRLRRQGMGGTSPGPRCSRSP
jgi:hypothetical protein